MYCTGCGICLGYFGHWPVLILSLLILFGIGVLTFRLIGNATGRSKGRASINNKEHKFNYNYNHPGKSNWH